MAKHAWSVDGYSAMKGLIRLRSQAAGVRPGSEPTTTRGDLELHVEVERRLDHDLAKLAGLQRVKCGCDLCD